MKTLNPSESPDPAISSRIPQFYALFFLLTLGIIGVLLNNNLQLREALQKAQSADLAIQQISLPSPQPSASPTPKPTNLSEKKVVNAELYVPSINEQFNHDWTAYINWDYGFSFLFPAKWQIDLSDDHMTIQGLTCRGCAGGFSGIDVEYTNNLHNLPLKEYIKTLRKGDINIEALELYVTKNKNIVAYVERQTPGAGEGKTAFIANNTNNDVVELYCGYCTDAELDHVIRTFDFEVERDEKESWNSYL